MVDRNLDFEAIMIANDLANIALRIEMLQAHPCYTDALVFAQKARSSVLEGRASIHAEDLKKRFG